MDYETVLPIKTVDDILKEIQETNDAGCNCNCKSEPTQEETNG